MFQFASPYYFFLLPLAAATAWFLYRRRIRAALVFPTAGRVPRPAATWRTRLARLLPLLYVAGLVLTVIALARPQTVLSRTRRTVDVIALEMVVDVSGSMKALDLSLQTPTGTRYRTRLDAVKTTFADFVAQRPDDLVGLITFGGYAVTRVPLTADHEALLHVLSGVEVPRETYVDGKIANREELMTAVGDALATGVARLKDSEPKSRVVVLLSDGESNTGVIRPEEAIHLARTLGIKVYTIGIGAPGSGRAPFFGKDMFGRQRVYYADVAMDEALLRRIAEATGGRYFNVRDPRGLESALADIDDLETTRVERDIYSQYNELFPWFLFPAAILLIGATGVNMLATRRLI